MTIATEIVSITLYHDDNSSVSNAVTEATSFCAMHDVTDDEIIKSAAIWILDRKEKEKKQMSNDSVAVPTILELHTLIETLKGKEVDTATKLITAWDSPKSKGLSPFS